jgi:hypothetical protein
VDELGASFLSLPRSVPLPHTASQWLEYGRGNSIDNRLLMALRTSMPLKVGPSTSDVMVD